MKLEDIKSAIDAAGLTLTKEGIKAKLENMNLTYAKVTPEFLGTWIEQLKHEAASALTTTSQSAMQHQAPAGMQQQRSPQPQVIDVDINHSSQQVTDRVEEVALGLINSDLNHLGKVSRAVAQFRANLPSRLVEQIDQEVTALGVNNPEAKMVEQSEAKWESILARIEARVA